MCLGEWEENDAAPLSNNGLMRGATSCWESSTKWRQETGALYYYRVILLKEMIGISFPFQNYAAELPINI